MDLFDAIEGRRSIRCFLPDPVEEEDLRRMLDAARRAPSGGNLQPWHFLVIRRRETISLMTAAILKGVEELERTAGEEEGGKAGPMRSLARSFRRSSFFFSSAPVTLAVFVDPNPHLEPIVDHMTGAGLARHEAERLLGHVEIQSVAAAIQNLLLAAHALGYGACWMNVPSVARDDLLRLLGFAPPRDLLALVPVGRPAPEQPGRPSVRRGLEEMATFA
jgi:nitroreductase